MTLEEFQASLTAAAPPPGLSLAVQGLWWDGKGDWAKFIVLADCCNSTDFVFGSADKNFVAGIGKRVTRTV